MSSGFIHFCNRIKLHSDTPQKLVPPLVVSLGGDKCAYTKVKRSIRLTYSNLVDPITDFSIQQCRYRYVFKYMLTRLEVSE